MPIALVFFPGDREGGIVSRSKITILEQLKREFFDWCEMLSLDEITSNPNLVRAAESVERSMLGQFENGSQT